MARLHAHRPPAAVDRGDPRLSPPLGGGGPSEAGEGLVTRLVGELAAAWERGECPPAEILFAQHPALRDDPEAAVRLIYEEVCLRRATGRDVTESELVHRFPRWRSELAVVLDCDRLLGAGTEPPRFPVAGETLGDFLLVAELGRGARGRCFLATQPSLAGRQVVLKVAPDGHGEHLSLARLQHTHIVPLYSQQRFPAQGLQALCMPYLGGSTLGQVLAGLRDVPPDRRTGLSLLGASAEDPGSASRAGPGPTRQFLARATYVRAICWVGACLADALQYAHDRGLVHMDVKPSNVMIAGDGQPMLLDFHLAREPVRAGEAPPGWLGGTPGYMSPEQREAVEAVHAGRIVKVGVDARSDVYSLGVVLSEALGEPTPGDAPPPARRSGPDDSPGLRDMIRKCLAEDPADRYPDAASLAEDLRRHMADQPLRGVANRSLAERWRKWCRRRPDSLFRLQTLVTAGALAAAVGVAVWVAFLAPRYRAAEHALLDGRAAMARREYPAAARALTRGAALIEGLPATRGLAFELADLLRLANHAKNLDRLHGLVERLRSLETAAPRSPRAARAVERHCRVFWDSRRPIVAMLGAGLDPESEERLRDDLLDLAVIWSGLHVRLAADGGGDGEGRARREALQVLDEAEAAFGPSHILYRERQAHAEALGLSGVARDAALGAARVPPRAAWEHAAVGRALLAAGDVQGAEAAFERALALQPEDFWPNFHQGVCAFRRGRFQDAVNAFRVAIALAPGRAEGYFNRALAYSALGRPALAALDYDHAHRLDPSLAAPPTVRATSAGPAGR